MYRIIVKNQDAIVSREQVRLKETPKLVFSLTVCAARVIPDKIRGGGVSGHRASNGERPKAVSVEPKTRYGK